MVAKIPRKLRNKEFYWIRQQFGVNFLLPCIFLISEGKKENLAGKVMVANWWLGEFKSYAYGRL